MTDTRLPLYDGQRGLVSRGIARIGISKGQIARDIEIYRGSTGEHRLHFKIAGRPYQLQIAPTAKLKGVTITGHTGNPDERVTLRIIDEKAPPEGVLFLIVVGVVSSTLMAPFLRPKDTRDHGHDAHQWAEENKVVETAPRLSIEDERWLDALIAMSDQEERRSPMFF